MFKFIFGLLWTSFVTPIFILCLVVPGEQRGGADMNFPLFCFFVIFEFVGLWMLYGGAKKIIINIKTKKYGKKCYGIVADIQKTGTYINGNPEYKAIVNLLNPETHQIETFEEIVGYDEDLYPVDSFVLCKYYQGDINFEKIVLDFDVPIDVKNILGSIEENLDYSDTEFSIDENLK